MDPCRERHPRTDRLPCEQTVPAAGKPNAGASGRAGHGAERAPQLRAWAERGRGEKGTRGGLRGPGEPPGSAGARRSPTQGLLSPRLPPPCAGGRRTGQRTGHRPGRGACGDPPGSLGARRRSRRTWSRSGVGHRHRRCPKRRAPRYFARIHSEKSGRSPSAPRSWTLEQACDVPSATSAAVVRGRATDACKERSLAFPRVARTRASRFF
jgi:hypothetical protein